MIERFEVGKSYRFIGDVKTLFGWTGFMMYLTDGKPHKCTCADGMNASFEDDKDPESSWDFFDDEDKFEEVIN